MSKFNQDIKNERDELYRIMYAIEIFEEFVKSNMSTREFKEVLQKKKIEQEELIYKLKNGLK